MARRVCPTSPTLTPAAVTTPAAAPCATERDITKIMSCPGVMINTSEATMNRNQETSSMESVPETMPLAGYHIQLADFGVTGEAAADCNFFQAWKPPATESALG